MSYFYTVFVSLPREGTLLPTGYWCVLAIANSPQRLRSSGVYMACSHFAQIWPRSSLCSM